MEPTNLTLIVYGLAFVAMLIGGLYLIAAAPGRYNGARSDEARYHDNWHTGERLATMAVAVVLVVVCFPVMILLEVMKDGK